MIQSDALSRRPDFTPENDTNNEDITMLPDELFVNLIDTELQERIANSENLDTDAAFALKTLLGNGPPHLRKDLEDWTTKHFAEKDVLFYKG